MSIFSKALKSIAGKATIAAVALGGFLALTPANASAQPVFVGRPGAHIVVRGGFYGPRYYGPRVFVGGGFYGPRYYGPVFVGHRYWDARFHCWRYR